MGAKISVACFSEGEMKMIIILKCSGIQFIVALIQ